MLHLLLEVHYPERWVKRYRTRFGTYLLWMRSSLVVRASDCQGQSRNSPEFDPSILRHSGI
jgi:hypothetical protein